MRPRLIRSKASWISKGFSACMLLTHLPSSQGPYSEDEMSQISGSPESSSGPVVYVCVSLLSSPLGHLHWFSEKRCSSSDSYKMNAYHMCVQIFQARILEWVAISFSRDSSWPRDQTCVSCIGKQIPYHCATWESSNYVLSDSLLRNLWPLI